MAPKQYKDYQHSTGTICKNNEAIGKRVARNTTKLIVKSFLDGYFE